MHAALAVLAAVVASHAAATPTRYLQLVNRAHDTVTALAIAPAGATTFEPLPLAESLHGSGATTLAVRGERCTYDVRVTFRDGRAVVYRGVDVCRRGGLYVDGPRRSER